MPCTPPVKPSIFLYFSNCGTASASAKVASARKWPASRKAGKPTRKPKTKQNTKAAGSVAQ